MKIFCLPYLTRFPNLNDVGLEKKQCHKYFTFFATEAKTQMAAA